MHAASSFLQFFSKDLLPIDVSLLYYLATPENSGRSHVFLLEQSFSSNSPEYYLDLKRFDSLSPYSNDSGSYHLDVEQLDIQTSSLDGLSRYNLFPYIEIFAK